ncbi:hypothetical protein IWX76_003539 [Pedobacter sp. CAN_A7]|uniref:hypothetical protein n=1 Tax=Pedobacter sp. CAN_A7 TaxID=2787722 RepID=UPI0018CB7E63
MKKIFIYITIICLCIVAIVEAKNTTVLSIFGVQKDMGVNSKLRGVKTQVEVAVNQIDEDPTIALESIFLYKSRASINLGSLKKSNFISVFGEPTSIETKFSEVYDNTVVTYKYDDCLFQFLDDDLVTFYLRDPTFRLTLGILREYTAATQSTFYFHQRFTDAWQKGHDKLVRMYITSNGIKSDAALTFMLKNDLTDIENNIIVGITFQF